MSLLPRLGVPVAVRVPQIEKPCSWR